MCVYVTNNVDLHVVNDMNSYWSFNAFYSARNCIASAVLATAIPSVRLSVTRWHCVKATARSTVQFAPLDSKMCPVL